MFRYTFSGWSNFPCNIGLHRVLKLEFESNKIAVIKFTKQRVWFPHMLRNEKPQNISRFNCKSLGESLHSRVRILKVLLFLLFSPYLLENDPKRRFIRVNQSKIWSIKFILDVTRQAWQTWSDFYKFGIGNIIRVEPSDRVIV